MGIYVNFPDGNEYLFDISYRDDEQLTSAEELIKKIRHDEEAREEILTLLKSREKRDDWQSNNTFFTTKAMNLDGACTLRRPFRV